MKLNIYRKAPETKKTAGQKHFTKYSILEYFTMIKNFGVGERDLTVFLLCTLFFTWSTSNATIFLCPLFIPLFVDVKNDVLKRITEPSNNDGSDKILLLLMILVF